MSKWANFLRATWAICSHRSFLVSDPSNSLTSLIKKEGMSESLVFFKLTRNVQKSTKKYNFSQIFLSVLLVFCEGKSEWAISSKKQVVPSFAHLLWAIYANRSQLLICHEWPERFAQSLIFLSDLLTVTHFPERFAHSRSFVLSHLSESLTVTQLIWGIWANEQMSNEPMSNEWLSKFSTLLLL